MFTSITHVSIIPPHVFICMHYKKKLKGNAKAFILDDDENESSIRRACSLSDLSMGKGKEKCQTQNSLDVACLNKYFKLLLLFFK